MIKTAQPYFKNKRKILKTLGRILSSGRLMEGEYARQFENNFAQYCGTKYAVSVNSCTTALEIVLRYLEVKDREVIVPTNTFIATPNAVVFAGGKPVFADIEPQTFCLDPLDLEKRITKKTKAVILVHIAGFISPHMEKIKSICRAYKINLIEDCAHAHGAEYKGKKAGSLGIAGCFSFYPTKIMTTGNGGMITTNSSELNALARSLRVHGRGESLSHIVNLGNDWFLDEIRCAIGLYQLRELEDMLRARRSIAAKYIQALRGENQIILPEIPENLRPAYYKFPLTLKQNAAKLKKTFVAKYNLELESLYYPPCHLQPIYRNKYRLPVAEDILGRQICLPIHTKIKKKDFEFVVGALRKELRK